MRASLTLDTSALDKLVRQFEDPAIRAALEQLPLKKAIVAIVAQAIADNFDKEGPGWQPLKAQTIRRSVSKAIQAKLDKMSDEELLAHEARESAKGDKGEPARRILRRTSLLMKTVTTPGFSGSAKSGGSVVTGKNVWKNEGTNLVWGTDLIYAGVHNKGDAARGIPKREFMVIREHWQKQLEEFMLREALTIISTRLGGGA